MEEQGALIFAHIAMAMGALLPALIMQLTDLDKPNKYMGYRTPWSLKSELTWRYSNKTCTLYLLWSGLITVFIQVISYFLFGAFRSILITTVALISGVILTMGITEVKTSQEIQEKRLPQK